MGRRPQVRLWNDRRFETTCAIHSQSQLLPWQSRRDIELLNTRQGSVQVGLSLWCNISIVPPFMLFHPRWNSYLISEIKATIILVSRLHTTCARCGFSYTDERRLRCTFWHLTAVPASLLTMLWLINSAGYTDYYCISKVYWCASRWTRGCQDFRSFEITLFYSERAPQNFRI